ncbi:MAG: F0F1 ATP synthase subunit B [Treponema sp.]|jgi:F-type H+-transporting ATPase subunit b|nr:F0F1 ATP synthase subunit B [Treponema sp.]
MLDFSVTFVITIINIIVLTIILRKILFKPVTKFMAERAKRVQDSIDQAEKDRVNSQKLLEQYHHKLKNADAEADEIIGSAREKAEVESRHIVAVGKAEAEALVAAARREIDAERQAAFARFKLEAAALVMAASARLVQREFSGEDNRRYASMLLDELAAQKGVD